MQGVQMFGKPDGMRLELIAFLSSFTEACDSSIVNEGMAIEILPVFVNDRVKEVLREAAPIFGTSTSA